MFNKSKVSTKFVVSRRVGTLDGKWSVLVLKVLLHYVMHIHLIQVKVAVPSETEIKKFTGEQYGDFLISGQQLFPLNYSRPKRKDHSKFAQIDDDIVIKTKLFTWVFVLHWGNQFKYFICDLVPILWYINIINIIVNTVNTEAALKKCTVSTSYACLQGTGIITQTVGYSFKARALT